MNKKNVRIKLNLPGGGSFEVEGDEKSAAKAAAELAKEMQVLQNEPGSIKRPRQKKPKGKRPRDILKKLLDGGFFDDWRTIGQVVDKLAEEGLEMQGQKVGPIAVVLSQWAKDEKFNLIKEELTDEERMHARGRFRYRVREKKLFDNKENQ